MAEKTKGIIASVLRKPTSGAPTPTKEKAAPKELPRDLELRNRFFPDAEEKIFDTTTKGYGPLPILLRKVLRHLSAPEVRVLVYLYTRASKYRICYPTIDEIADDLGLNRKNVTPHISSLERKKLIETHASRGRRYFLILDPRVGLQELVDRKDLKGDELFSLNLLCDDLKRNRFSPQRT